MDYDAYAERYAHTREAVPWVLGPLEGAVRRLPAGAVVVEIGCGTGNYVAALAEALPEYDYRGFDASKGMLAVARARSARIAWTEGNADVRFPYPDAECRLAFAVDVVHHIRALDVFFREAARTLSPGGSLMVVTDSEQNIRERSLTRFFPEILDIELRRYPSVSWLHARAAAAGLDAGPVQPAVGDRVLDSHFVGQLEAKCSSAMRLIAPEAHRRGMERVREASARGERWHSCYTILAYDKPENSRSRHA